MFNWLSIKREVIKRKKKTTAKIKFPILKNFPYRLKKPPNPTVMKVSHFQIKKFSFLLE